LNRPPLFHPYHLGVEERQRLDQDGHLLLPGLLTEQARARLVTSMAAIEALRAAEGVRPQHYSAEYDEDLARLIAHPQLLGLARQVLGPEIRFDHCVALNRPPGDQGTGWHSHAYAEDRPELGFLRIFFYVNGFSPRDGALAVVPGSHLFRDPGLSAGSDEALQAGWLAGKRHPITGEPLAIEYLTALPGSVVLMWTHAAHAVCPRRTADETRWTVVYAYRNPGAESRARWISEPFERAPPEGAEGLMGLY
jgi:Phytanoyl-CoA dioxygenase (PhyH)